MSYRDHNERALASYDRWLTTPPEPPEYPEEAYCTSCEGQGELLIQPVRGDADPEGRVTVCLACKGTGIDPVWEAKMMDAQKAENAAIDEAYAKQLEEEKDWDKEIE